MPQPTPPRSAALAASTLAAAAANAPSPGVRNARAVALAGLVALIALCLAWELWLAPTGKGSLALKALPLVLCLAGLLRHRMVIFRWLAMLLWLYVLEGLVRGTTERGPSQAFALGEIALCLLLFCTCTVYIRWRLKNGLQSGSEPTKGQDGGKPSSKPSSDPHGKPSGTVSPSETQAVTP